MEITVQEHWRGHRAAEVGEEPLRSLDQGRGKGTSTAVVLSEADEPHAPISDSWKEMVGGQRMPKLTHDGGRDRSRCRIVGQIVQEGTRLAALQEHHLVAF